jgi:hypothetical protein
MDRAIAVDRPVPTYRALLLALAAASIVVTASELAIARHWDGLGQWIAWALLAMALVAVGLLAVRPDRLRLDLARVLGAIVIAGALFGVYKHIDGNYRDGASRRATAPTGNLCPRRSGGGEQPTAAWAEWPRSHPRHWRSAASSSSARRFTRRPGRRSHTQTEQRDEVSREQPPRRRAS